MSKLDNRKKLSSRWRDQRADLGLAMSRCGARARASLADVLVEEGKVKRRPSVTTSGMKSFTRALDKYWIKYAKLDLISHLRKF